MGYYDNEKPFSVLVGKTITKLTGGEIGDEEIGFYCSDGKFYRMFHAQDCCEHVRLEDVAGDLSDLVDSPVLTAEESSSEDIPDGVTLGEYHERPQWTFYRISTAKGLVVLRWYGESDYYSTSMDFVEA